MNEPYDVNNAAYHDKIIKDYTTLKIFMKIEVAIHIKVKYLRVVKGLGFTEADFDKVYQYIKWWSKN